MKRKSFYFVLAALIITMSFPARVFSHAEGKPYITINGKPVDKNDINQLYPEVTSEDIAPEAYEVNKTLTVAYDADAFGADPDQIRWDWGNGTVMSGKQRVVKYAYPKAGTYTATIALSMKPGDEFTDINTVKMDILPKEGYVLPSATVAVRETSRTSKEYTLEFEAAASNDPSAKLEQYDWDFGDNTKGSGQKVEHTYPVANSLVFPRLRLTDSNGIYSDTTFEVTHSNEGVTNVQDSRHMPAVVSSFTPTENSGSKTAAIIGLAVATLLVIACITILYKKRKNKNS